LDAKEGEGRKSEGGKSREERRELEHGDTELKKLCHQRDAILTSGRYFSKGRIVPRKNGQGEGPKEGGFLGVDLVNLCRKYEDSIPRQ